MIRFENSIFLYGLIALAVIALLFGWFLFNRKKAVSAFAKPTAFPALASNASMPRTIVKFFLILIAIAALVFTLANPQIGTKYETVKREGVDVIIALDVSKSMLAEDIAPNRILKAKQLVSNLIDKMTNDRIGLIVFAGNAYLQMPLTVDYTFGKSYLKNVDTDMMPSQGTAIGDAVNLAIRSFNQEEEKYKALVIISDGENHEGDAEEAISEAKENGIKVFTVGVGSMQGAPIPIDKSGNYKKDMEGNVVLTKLNENMMKELAAEGNGKYFNIQEGNLTNSILNEFGSMEGKAMEEKVVADFKDQFLFFAIIALIFLLLEFLIAERKQRLLNKFEI